MRNPEVSPETAAGQGYYMPAEWYPHEATWLTWPKNEITWPDKLEEAREAYLCAMAALAPHERVELLVDNEQMRQDVRHRLARREIPLAQVNIHVLTTVDSWIRDYGPNFLIRESDQKVDVAYNNWVFNAWGNKYEDLLRDDDVPERLADYLEVPAFKPGIVLEGGSIDVNGSGTCLTTRQCLLNPNRNPHLTQDQIEQTLRESLGVNEVIWLGDGIDGDDTDGHVDDIVRFVDESTIVCVVEDDPDDSNFDPLQENFAQLRHLSEDGARFRIVPLLMPEPFESDWGRLPASYANFYIANNVVLVPTFGQPRDLIALETLAPLFPGRQVIGINSRDLVLGMGTIHCLSQQQPRGR